jgi:hypothetical protein
MGRFDVDRSLQKLQSEGESLVSDGHAEGSQVSWLHDSVTAWYAAVFDVLTSSLPESSRLLARLEHAWNRYSGKPSENDVDSRRLIVQGRSHIEDQGDAPKLLARCLPIISQARRVILSRPLTADEEKDIRREIRAAITETYLSVKGWWFYIPSAVLLLSIVFVVTGAIQIRDVRIDVRAQADEALKNAKERLDTQIQDIQRKVSKLDNEAQGAIESAKKKTISELNARLGGFISAEETKIESATKKKVEEIESKSAMPGLIPQIDTIQKRIDDLRIEVSKVNERAQGLDESLKRLAPASEGGARGLFSNQLAKPTTFVVFEFVVASISCALSLLVVGYLTVGWCRRVVVPIVGRRIQKLGRKV